MKLTFEQQMGMLAPQFQEQFHNEQKAEWDKVQFNSTAITDTFARYREFGLMFETPVGLGVTPSYFCNLMYNPDIESYTVSDIITLCRAFERRTQFEWMQITGGRPEGRQEYADFLSCMEQITNEVNAIVEPIKDKLVRKMQTLQKLQAQNGNRTIALS